MSRQPLAWIGLAGVDPDDNARAQAWERRLHWIMAGIALLAVPAYILGQNDDRPAWNTTARILDALIFVAFLLETFWMASISSLPRRHLVRNWMNLAILLASGASFLGSDTQWIAVVRVLRVGIGGLVLLKVGVDFTALFTRRGAPLLTGAAAGVALITGSMLFWLEPGVRTFWDGVWLAFVTATTIGYGDMVPMTAAGRVVAVIVSLAGWALLSLFTANVVAAFLDRDEIAERRRIAEEIAMLRGEIAKLADPSRTEAHDVALETIRGSSTPTAPGDLAAEVDALHAEVAALAARTSRLAAALHAAQGRAE